MSEQTEQKELHFEEVEEVPHYDVEVVKQPQQPIVMPNANTIGQKMVDTAMGVVCSTIIVGAANLVVQGPSKALRAGGAKIKHLNEARKERLRLKKAEKLAALAAAQEAQGEETPEENPVSEG